MEFIVIVGPKGSGKDAAFDILKKEKMVHGKIAFAGPLKDILSEQFDIHPNFLNDAILKEKPFATPIKLSVSTINRLKWAMHDYVDPEGENFYNIHRGTIQNIENRLVETPRELMQLVGTELYRKIYPDWHVRAVLSDEYLGSKNLTKSGTYVITDCRFLNELQVFVNNPKHKAKFIYIDRPEAQETLKTATHASELETIKLRELIESGLGKVVDNSGTLDEFKANLKKAIGSKK